MLVQDPVTTPEIEAFKDEYGGHWSEHPEYPHSDWVQEVLADHTRLGYWEWVYTTELSEKEYQALLVEDE